MRDTGKEKREKIKNKILNESFQSNQNNISVLLPVATPAKITRIMIQ
jgi:hypothetical protein